MTTLTPDRLAVLRDKWEHARFSEKQGRWLTGNNLPMRTREDYLQMCIAYPERLQQPWVDQNQNVPREERNQMTDQVDAQAVVVNTRAEFQPRTQLQVWAIRLIPDFLCVFAVIIMTGFLVLSAHNALNPGEALTYRQIMLWVTIAVIIGICTRLVVRSLMMKWISQTEWLRRDVQTEASVAYVTDVHRDDI